MAHMLPVTILQALISAYAFQDGLWILEYAMVCTIFTLLCQNYISTWIFCHPK